jgi:hypothetical protein
MTTTYIIKEDWSNKTYKGGLFPETHEGQTFNEVVEAIWGQYGDKGVSPVIVLRIDIEGSHALIENVSDKVAAALETRNANEYPEDRREHVTEFCDREFSKQPKVGLFQGA